MSNKQKSGGGSRKISRDSAKCKLYIGRMTRFKNKMKRYLKHNVPKDATEQEIIIYKNVFTKIQEGRKKK